MRNISELLQIISQTPKCVVKHPEGLPIIEQKHALPRDMLEFYTLCGGVSLYQSAAYSVEIVPPDSVVIANPVILLGIDEDGLKTSSSDLSWSWYVIGEGQNRQFITIDLAPERVGRCYDSFWDSHAMPGYSPIITQSFAELLSRLITNRGEHWYWLQPNFQSMGDAYD